MHAGQRIPCIFGVVKQGAHPGVQVVAGLALRGKP